MTDLKDLTDLAVVQHLRELAADHERTCDGICATALHLKAAAFRIINVMPDPDEQRRGFAVFADWPE